MKKRLQKLFATLSLAYPSGSSPYWRALPLGQMKTLLAGTFLVASAGGFAANLLQFDALKTGRLGGGLFWPLFAGTLATTFLVARIKKISLVLLFLASCGIVWLFYWISLGSTPLPSPEVVRQRVVFDAIGVMFGVGIGFRLLLYFVTTEGLANVRMATEFSLAHAIQAALVPAVSFQSSRLEVYGKSIPSTEMGGDLIDVVETDGSLLVYVADVSGHGLPAGQLMGMLKTAMRVSFQFSREPTALLESADRVLPAMKEPDMFATMALLYFDCPTEAQYAVAGHVPILHYRDRSRDIVRLSMEQFPLGLIPGGGYQSSRVVHSQGDVFLMVSDGIPETPNEKEEEFGLGRVELLLTNHAAEPLPRICELIMDEVKRYGEQRDDQSLLLLRVRE
jgi:serine phosphatase RsbU (regulator of sigma subunit)